MKTLATVHGAYGEVIEALAHSLTTLNSPAGFEVSLRALTDAAQTMYRLERLVVAPALEAALRVRDRIDLLLEVQVLFDEQVGMFGVEGTPQKASSHSGPF